MGREKTSTVDKIVEFFEADDGRSSMTRLLMFLAFFPASYVVIVNSKNSNIGDLLGWYLGAFVCGYLGGKGAECFNRSRPLVDTQKEDNGN